MGQSRRFDRELITSALPRLADIPEVSAHVGKVPMCDIEHAGRSKESRPKAALQT
jgi:hypothetical protein